MLSWRCLAVLTVCVVAATGCQHHPDLDAYRAEILSLHRGFIEAHWAKDAATLAEPTAEDYLFVAGGEVFRRSREEVEEGLARYLAATDFSVYEDVSEPIIGFSQDGTLAWAIVQVRVAGARETGEGAAEPFDTLWAWITLYERRGERWMRLADVSTLRPFEEEA